MQEEYEEYNPVETEIVPCRRNLNLDDDLNNARDNNSHHSRDSDNNSLIQNNENNEEDNETLLEYMCANNLSQRPKVQKVAIMKDMFDTSTSSDKNVNVSKLEINSPENIKGKKKLRLNLTKLRKNFLIKDRNHLKELENRIKIKPSLTENEDVKSKIVKIPNIAHTLKRLSINKKGTNSFIPKKTHLVCQTSLTDKSSVVLPSLSINQTLPSSSRISKECNMPNSTKTKTTALKKHLLKLKDNKKLTIFSNYETNRTKTIDTASCSISLRRRSINSISNLSKYK